MHSLTCSGMQEELVEARQGFSLAASRVAQPAAALAGKGSDLAPEPHLEGSSRALLCLT